MLNSDSQVLLVMSASGFFLEMLRQVCVSLSALCLHIPSLSNYPNSITDSSSCFLLPWTCEICLRGFMFFKIQIIKLKNAPFNHLQRRKATFYKNNLFNLLAFFSVGVRTGLKHSSVCWELQGSDLKWWPLPHKSSDWGPFSFQQGHSTSLSTKKYISIFNILTAHYRQHLLRKPWARWFTEQRNNCSTGCSFTSQKSKIRVSDFFMHRFFFVS